MATKTLLRINTDFLEEKLAFPAYEDVFFQIMEPDKPSPLPVTQIKHDIRTPGRQPSPQPTHFSTTLPRHEGYSEHNGHRILRSGTVGYSAPVFRGKQEQQNAG